MSDKYKDVDDRDKHLVIDLDLDVDSSIFDDDDDDEIGLSPPPEVEDSINSSIIKEILVNSAENHKKDVVVNRYSLVVFGVIMFIIPFLLIGFIVGLDELIGLNCEEIGCNCGHPFIINGIYDLLNGSS